jgi:hypothetical protein
MQKVLKDVGSALDPEDLGEVNDLSQMGLDATE